MTPTAQAFVNANKESKVVEGVILDKNKRNIRRPEDAAYMRYKLKDGRVFDLAQKDTLSMTGANVTANWDV